MAQSISQRFFHLYKARSSIKLVTVFVFFRVGRRPAFVPGWRGKPTGQLRRSGAGGGECLLAMRRFDAIESRSDCRDSPVFVVAR